MVWDMLLAPLESQGVLQAIDDAYEVTPGIRTRHLPGHTPGHQIVHVADGGASLLLSGDAIKRGIRRTGRSNQMGAYGLNP